MHSWRIKILFAFLMAGLAMSTAHGQLLQDRNKLKTERRLGQGFNFFKKQVKKSSRKSKVVKASSPKTSSGAINGRVLRVSPKYSQSVAGAGSQRKVNPKYSRIVAGKGSDRSVNPKFTRDIAGKGGFRNVNPKYSKMIAGQGSDRSVNPKYSKVIAGQGGDRSVNPKFSRDQGNMGSYVARKPRTVSNKGMVFVFPAVLYYIKRPKNHGEDAWNLPKSPGKIKKEGMSFHPSSAHLTAKYKTSALVRNGLQKFNILWVRVNGNKSRPKGVYKKSKKLKFDKDEKDIWNNKEREYTHN